MSNEDYKISETQLKVMQYLYAEGPSRSHRPVARKGWAHYLSAARALKRKGLAYSYKTGMYGLTEAGWAWYTDYKASLTPSAP